MLLSEDGGATWEALQEGRSRTLMGAALHRGAIYAGGFGGHLLRSEDGGRRWAPPPGLPKELEGAHTTALAGDGRRLALGTVGGVWVLEGEAWSLVRAPSDGRLGEVRRLAWSGGVLALSANGTLWRGAGAELAEVPVSFVSGAAPGRVLDVAPLADGEVLVSSVGGLGVGKPGADGLALRRLEVDRGTEAPVTRLWVAPGGGVWLGGPGGVWGWERGVEGEARQRLVALPVRCHDVIVSASGEALLGCAGGVVLSAPPPYVDWAAAWTGSWGRIERLVRGGDGALWAITREGALLRREANAAEAQR